MSVSAAEPPTVATFKRFQSVFADYGIRPWVAEIGDERVPDQIWQHIRACPSGCWLWTGHLNSHGYGRIGMGRRYYMVHRLNFELLVGPIEDGLHIDHMCRVRACVNPAHLEPVTALENARRRPYVPMTHCVNGHAYTPENTQQHCRTCDKARQTARRRARQHDAS